MTHRNPLRSHIVRQTVTETTAGAPAVVLLHVHRGLGLEKLLDHLRAAAARRRVQRGPASVRSLSCGRSRGSPDAIQNLMNVFKFHLLNGSLSRIPGKTLCEEHGETKINIGSVRRQETGDLLRQAHEHFSGFQGWFPWKLSSKRTPSAISCRYLNQK